MNIYSASLLCFAFGFSLVAFLVLAKRRDRVALKFLFFSITVCGWSFFESLWFTMNYPYDVTLFFGRLGNLFAIWIPITWLHFVLDFLGKREPVKGFYTANYFIALFMTAISPTEFFVSGLHSILDLKYYTTPGPLYHIFTVIFAILVPIGFIYLIKAYKEHSARREQLKYFIAATIIGFTAGGTTFFGVYKIPVPLYLLPFMTLYPLLMGIALIKYGLFDVQQIADAFQREKLAAIGTMAASLNHELRNPLYIAKGRIESYLDSEKEGLYPTLEEKHKNADKALEAASSQLTRAMDIIQRFSDFAKPFNARKDREKVDLAGGFKDVLELVSNEFQMQKIRLRVESVEGQYATVNFRQLEEILFNLIINACHAMEEKGGELTLSASQAGKKTVIAISDTGPGIAEDDLRQIFEPFYSTKGEKGSGLGLYITKQLVEKNGGKITVESKVGRGTIFRLEFDH